MERKANNHLGCALLDKGETKVLLLRVGAKQAALKGALLRQLCAAGRGGESRVCALGPASALRLLPAGVAATELDPAADPAGLAAALPAPSSVRGTLLLLGLELLAALHPPAAVDRALSEALRVAPTRGFKAVVLLCCPELLDAPWPAAHAHFALDFAEGGATREARACEWGARGLLATELLPWTFESGRVLLRARAAPAAQPQRRDPDDLFQAPFKLGLSAAAQAERARLELPHFGPKQLEELRARAEELDGLADWEEGEESEDV